MKVLSEKKILKVSIRYPLNERDDVYDYLDKTYGRGNWRATRCGPVVPGGEGLTVAEVDQE